MRFPQFKLGWAMMQQAWWGPSDIYSIWPVISPCEHRVRTDRQTTLKETRAISTLENLDRNTFKYVEKREEWN